MDTSTYTAAVKAIHAGQVAALRDGYVLPPRLFAFRSGRPIGYVVLRQVTVGEDAAHAIIDLAMLAAASHADEIIACWETSDLATAVDDPPIYDACLNILWADPNRHALYTYPYVEKPIGRTHHGTHSIAPAWGKHDQVVGGLLHRFIQLMLDLCWEDIDADLDQVAGILAAKGYTVNLADSRDPSS